MTSNEHLDDQARLRQLADEAETRRVTTAVTEAKTLLFCIGFTLTLIAMTIITNKFEVHIWLAAWIIMPISIGIFSYTLPTLTIKR